MGFWSDIDKEMLMIFILNDLIKFLGDFLGHLLEDLRLISFLSEELKDLEESFNELLKKFDFVLIRCFVVVVFAENDFFNFGAVVDEGVETCEVIVIFLDLLESLLDDK